jgi:hypothetical protein
MYGLADVEVFQNCVTFSPGLPHRRLQIAALQQVWQGFRKAAPRG